MSTARVPWERIDGGVVTGYIAEHQRIESGQATIEAVAGVAALMLTGLLGFQLMVTGYSATVAGGAAEAGAIALIRGEPVEPAVREALPGWARSRVSVSTTGPVVEVRLRPPALVPSLSDALAVSSEAGAR